MKFKTRLVAITVALTMVAMVAIAPVSAQHSHDHNGNESWKTGMVRLTTTAWAGNVRLERGMYHVKHVIDGQQHWLVFKAVTLRAGYQEGFMWEGHEVARVECRVAPADKSLRNTRAKVEKIGHEQVIAEIQIAGENVRHLLLNDSPA